VHALLAARIDRLAAREKDVLQTAAVIGKEFDEPTLAAVVEQDAPQLREALQKLKETEFVREQSLYPVVEYMFKHPLTQEVALTTQLQEKRKRLHAAVAEVIEAAHSDDLDQQAALLAHHWEQSGNLAHAVRWHTRAAEWTSTRDAIEGIKHWRKVRELGRSLDDRDAKESRLRACVVVLANGWRLGIGEDEVRSGVEEARILAQQLDQPSTFAVALASYALSLPLRGENGEALKHAEEAFKMIVHGGATNETLVSTEGMFAYVLHCAGRLPQAFEHLDHMIALSQGDASLGRNIMNFSMWIWAEIMKASSLAYFGRFKESQLGMDRALRLLKDLNEPDLVCRRYAELILGTYLAHGTWRDETADLRSSALEAVGIAEEKNNQFFQVFSSLALGIAFHLNADYADCETQLKGTLEHARRIRNFLDYEGWFLAILAHSRLSRGDALAAIKTAREGLGATDASDAWFQGALVRTVLADALIEAGEPDTEVRAVIAEARELVRKSGGHALLPRLREAEARLAGRSDRAARIAGLREAEAMWRTMGAPDPADRLLREIASAAD
jgi:adenylate cyclase